MTLTRVGLSGRKLDREKKSGWDIPSRKGERNSTSETQLLEKPSERLPREQTSWNAI